MSRFSLLRSRSSWRVLLAAAAGTAPLLPRADAATFEWLYDPYPFAGYGEVRHINPQHWNDHTYGTSSGSRPYKHWTADGVATDWADSAANVIQITIPANVPALININLPTSAIHAASVSVHVATNGTDTTFRSGDLETAILSKSGAGKLSFEPTFKLLNATEINITNGTLALQDDPTGTITETSLDAGTLAIGNHAPAGAVVNASFVLGRGALNATAILLGTVHDTGVGAGTLNTSLSVTGGTVTTGTLILGSAAPDGRTVNATLDLKGGATLAVDRIEIGTGDAVRKINWDSATFRNRQGQNLFIESGITLTLPTTGQHVFDITSTATVAAKLTGGGTVTKLGTGTLKLGLTGAAVDTPTETMDINLLISAGIVDTTGRVNGPSFLAAGYGITIGATGTLWTSADSLGANTAGKITINSGGLWEMHGDHSILAGNLELNSGTIAAAALAPTSQLKLSGDGTLRVTGIPTALTSTIKVPVLLDSVNVNVNTVASGPSIATLIFEKTVSGTGNFVKSGSGNVRFTGAATYTGTTIVHAGTIFFTTANPTSTAFQMDSGASVNLSRTTPVGTYGTLTISGATESFAGRTSTAGTADIIGAVTIQNGGVLSVGGRNTVETLTITETLDLQNGSTVRFTLGETANDKIRVGRLATPSGYGNLATLQINAPDGLYPSGTYDLFELTDDTLNGNEWASLTWGGIPTLRSSGVNNVQLVTAPGGTVVQLVILEGNHKLEWNGNKGSGSDTVWLVQTGDTLWQDATPGYSGATQFYNGDVAVFNDRGGTSNALSVSIVEAVSPSRVIVEGSKTYTLNSVSGGKITGESALTKRGTGRLILTSAHDFTGTVELNSGVIELTGSDALLAAYSAPSALGAGRDAGAVVFNGGTLRFSGNAMTQTPRSFTLGPNGGTIDASQTMSASALVVFNNTAESVAHTGSGNRTLRLIGDGGGNYATSMPTAGGVMWLKLTDPADGSGKLKVVKSGLGTWALGTGNSYSGGTEINGGMLLATDDSAFGKVPDVYDPTNIIFSGEGTLFNTGYTAGSNNIWSNAGATITLAATRGIYLNGGGVIRLGWNQPLVVNGGISGPGSLTKRENGLLTLKGENTFEGGLSIANGAVQVENASGGAPLGGDGGVIFAGNTTTLNIAGVDLHITRLSDASGEAAGFYTSTITNTRTGTNITLFLGEGNDYDSTYHGVLTNGGADRTLGLTKRGTGTLTLSLAANVGYAYSGPLNIEEGVLTLGNASAIGSATDITVLDGATLNIGTQDVGEGRVIHITGTGALGEGGALVNYPLNRVDAVLRTGNADNIQLADSTTIVTEYTLNIRNVEGAGDLSLLGYTDAAATATSAAFHLTGTNAKLALTAGADGSTTGNLSVNAALTVTASTGAVSATGGIIVNAGGNLTLDSSDGTDNLIVPNTLVRLAAGGKLSFSGDTVQEFTDFASVATDALIRHTPTGGYLDTDAGTLIVNMDRDSMFAGRIGHEERRLPMTGGTFYPVYEAIPGTDQLNFIKRGSGTFTLSNGASDYSGYTRIEGGTLVLLAPLSTVSYMGGSANGTAYSSGVLGSTPNAASYLVIDGATLRDQTSQPSETSRLFTIGAHGATIESTVPTGGTVGYGLRFLSTGNIAFANDLTSDVTLTLGGNKTTSNLNNANLLAPSLRNPTGFVANLRKSGSGLWVLAGNNTYTGSTNVENGTIALGSSTALPVNTHLTLGNNGLNSSATLRLNGFDVTLGALVSEGPVTTSRIVNDAATVGGVASTTVPKLTMNIAGANTVNTFDGILGSARPVDNTFGLVKQGTGVLALSGATAYIGDTEVREGILRLTNATSKLGSTYTFVDAVIANPAVAPKLEVTSSYFVETNTTLVAGKIKADVVADNAELLGNFYLNGGTLWIGGSKTVLNEQTQVADKTATLTLDGSLYSQNGANSTLAYTLDLTPTEDNPDAVEASDLLLVRQLILDGPTYIHAVPTGYRLSEGEYKIIHYSEYIFLPGVQNLRFNPDDRYDVTFESRGNVAGNGTGEGDIIMVVGDKLKDVGNDLFWTASTNTQWGNPSATGKNFYQREAPAPNITFFVDGDKVTFDNRVSDAADRTIVISDAVIQPSRVTFQNDTGFDYTLAATGGKIGGTGWLEKYGTGVLNVNNENTYSGGTYIGGGTLRVGHDSALGTGTLFMDGGTLSNSGTRHLNNPLNVRNNSTVNVAASTSLTLNGNLTGSATLTKTGTGELHFGAGAANGATFGSTLALTQGSLTFDSVSDHGHAAYILTTGTVLTAGFSGDGAVYLGSLSGNGTVQSTTGAKTFAIGARNDLVPAIFSGIIQDGTGVVTLEKVGTASTLVLSGTSTYTGPTLVTEGILQVGIGSAGSGSGKLGNGPIFIGDAGTLRYNGSVNQFNNATGASTTTITQTITSTGVLEKVYGDTLVLPNNNPDLGGTIRILDGILQVGTNGNTGDLGTANIVNDASLVFDRTGLDFTIVNDMDGTGTLVKKNANALIYTGNNIGTGDTFIQNGTLAIGTGAVGAPDQVYASENIHLINTTLQLNANDGTTLSLTGGIAGIGTINKDGDGTAILSGASTMSGGLNINAGTLQVGLGGNTGSIEGGTQIRLDHDATLLFKRSGTITLLGRIYSTVDSTIRVEGGADGTGTVIFAENNEILGDVIVANKTTLQLGEGNKTGTFNNTGGVVNVQLETADSRLAYNRSGTELTTGSAVTISGAGSFVKLGKSTVTFNSHGEHTGGTIVTEGRLLIPTENLPAAFSTPGGTGYLEADGTGVLELLNGTTPFALEGRIQGDGVIALGAADTVGTGTYTRYEYTSASATNTLSTLEVGAKTQLELGTAATVRVANLNLLTGSLLTGSGAVAGSLKSSTGSEIRLGTPDAPAGHLDIAGNFTGTGNLYIDIARDATGALIYDTVTFSGSAQISGGAKVIFDLSALAGVMPETGTEIRFLVDSDLANNPLGASVIGGFIADSALGGKGFVYNNGTGSSLLFANSISAIFDKLNRAPHDGLNGFAGYLDKVLATGNTNPAPAETITRLLGATDFVTAYNNASPLGLASITALSITSAQDAADTLHAHLESLRYNRAVNGQNIDATPYIVATGIIARNDNSTSSPTFNLNTYGALVGVDHSLTAQQHIGINAGYSHGRADLHNGGGSVNSDSAIFSVYGTNMVNDRVYVDAQAFVGFNTYDVRHQTYVGKATASPTGYSSGLNASIGGIFAPTPHFHLTPYASLEFVHSTVDDFTEKGSTAALAVDGFNQDSLRAKIGTGFNWIVPTGADFSLRVGLDVAYAYELLDSDVDIAARFANDANRQRKFSTTAPATPEHSLQIGPVVDFGFGANTALRFGYTLETDFDSQQIHHLNATLRVRF